MKKVKYHRYDDTVNENLEDKICAILSDYDYDKHVVFFCSEGGSLISMVRIRDMINTTPAGRITMVFSGFVGSATTELLFSLKQDRVRIIPDYLTLDIHLYGANIRLTAVGPVTESDKRDKLDVEYEWYKFKEFWSDKGLNKECLDEIYEGKDVCLSSVESVELCTQNKILEYAEDK